MHAANHFYYSHPSHQVQATIKCLLLPAVLLAALPISTHSQVVIGAPATHDKAGGAPSAATKFAPAMRSQLPLLKRGGISVRPHFSYGIMKGDGILSIGEESASTTMQTISPGVLFEVGQHLNIHYTLTRSMYSERRLFDTTDHNASVRAATMAGGWDMSLTQSYSTNSPTLVDTAEQTHEETTGTSAAVARKLGIRTSLAISADHLVRSASSLTKNTAWTGSDWKKSSLSGWLKYSLSDRASVAAGVTQGYDRISNNPDMAYTQPQVEVAWKITKKIDISLLGGIEIRTSQGQHARSENIVYSGSVTYAPTATTRLSASSHQDVSNSYFANQATRSRGWDISAEQRVLHRLLLAATFLHGNTSYLLTERFTGTGRDDEYESYKFSISTPVLVNGSISVFFMRGENVSQFRIYNLTSTQYGANVAYRF